MNFHRVADLLRELASELDSAATANVVYSTRHLPDGFTDGESFNVACRRAGIDPKYKCGRAWRVPASVWHEARRGARKHAPKSDEQLADALLDSNPRFRLVKGNRS